MNKRPHLGAAGAAGAAAAAAAAAAVVAAAARAAAAAENEQTNKVYINPASLYFESFRPSCVLALKNKIAKKEGRTNKKRVEATKRGREKGAAVQLVIFVTSSPSLPFMSTK
jgi:hypothetical protein